MFQVAGNGENTIGVNTSWVLAAGGGVFGRGGLRGPIQRVNTTLGWLQRGEGTAVRLDSRLAGGGHMYSVGGSVV